MTDKRRREFSVPTKLRNDPPEVESEPLENCGGIGRTVHMGEQDKPKVEILVTEWEDHLGQSHAFYEHGDTVLDALSNAGVFSVAKAEDGKLRFCDACSGEYSASLTKQQLMQLIDELKQLAES